MENDNCWSTNTPYTLSCTYHQSALQSAICKEYSMGEWYLCKFLNPKGTIIATTRYEIRS